MEVKKPSTARHVPALDGLRGVAILAVVVHHQLTPFTLRGGFLGVDLFFVLSGFLITSLLLTEHQITKSISIPKFYMRRVLRLGPALALYLIGAILINYHTQLIEVTRQLKLIGLVLVYATNWRMALGWDSVLDPTAIIWSLSIEEQFYLVWPLLLMLCLTFNVKRRYLAIGLVVTITAILAHRANLLIQGVELTRLYYGTDTRADSLLMGCLFAMLPIAALKFQVGLKFGALAAAISFSFLLIFAEYGDRFLYLGGFTAISLLCGIIIWVVAQSPSGFLSTLLSWSVLRWFGQISYGLYLWHWLVVRNVSFYYLGWLEAWARLALAVGIAAASFYLIERRFNRLKTRYSAGTPRLNLQTTVVESPIPPFEASLVR